MTGLLERDTEARRNGFHVMTQRPHCRKKFRV
jgi:hypothetical protein